MSVNFRSFCLRIPSISHNYSALLLFMFMKTELPVTPPFWFIEIVDIVLGFMADFKIDRLFFRLCWFGTDMNCMGSC